MKLELGAGHQTILDYHHAVPTKAAFVLLVLSIVATGLATIGFSFGILKMLRSRNSGQRITKQTVPLMVLRCAFFACVTAASLSTISSAKITVSAKRSSGGFVLGNDQIIHAWTHGGFLTLTWVATGLVWVALTLALAAAFKIAPMLREQEHRPKESYRRWYRL